MSPDKKTTTRILRNVVNKVCAEQLTKTSIFSYDEVYEASEILNGAIPLVEVAIRIAQDTMLPLSYWADQISKKRYCNDSKQDK